MIWDIFIDLIFTFDDILYVFNLFDWYFEIILMIFDFDNRIFYVFNLFDWYFKIILMIIYWLSIKYFMFLTKLIDILR